jgi:hypothetical protein
MKLEELLLNYFSEEGVKGICASLRVPPSGGKEEMIKAIIANLDARNDSYKAEEAMEVIFDSAFELDEATLRKNLADSKLETCGSKVALLNRVMASLVWPKSIEALVARESKLTGDISSVRI